MATCWTVGRTAGIVVAGSSWSVGRTARIVVVVRLGSRRPRSSTIVGSVISKIENPIARLVEAVSLAV